MSYAASYTYTCNGCTNQSQSESNGLPMGWWCLTNRSDSGQTEKHACSDACAALILGS